MNEKMMGPAGSAGKCQPAGSQINAGELYSREMERLTMPQSLRNNIQAQIRAGRCRSKRWLRPVAGCAAALLVACGAWSVWRLGQMGQENWLSVASESSSDDAASPTPQNSSTDSADPERILSFPQVENVQQDVNRQYVPGYFTEAPDSEALSIFLGGLPDAFPDWQVQALVGYSGEGEAIEMTAEMTSSAHPHVSLRLESGTARCYPLPEDGASESYVGAVRVVSGQFPVGEDGTSCYYATVSSLSDTDLSITLEGVSATEDAAVWIDQMVQQILSATVNEESRTGDLSLFTPTQIPQWRDERLTLQQARADRDFGSHLPAALPEGFAYEGEQPAHRVLGQNRNDLSILAYRTGSSGYCEISVRYSYDSKGRTVVKQEQVESYDLTPYAIPWADTMPESMRETLENPLFFFDDLTLEMVQKRCYHWDDQGDGDGTRCRFSVQFADGVVAEIWTKGLEAEEIFQLLQSMGHS